MLNSVVLPAPFGPMTETISPGFHRKADIVDGPQAAEIDAEALDLKRLIHPPPLQRRAIEGSSPRA
jgi:hypothetical protein